MSFLILITCFTDTTGDVELEWADFRAALDGFTPAALRQVALHEAGEQGWEAVGGLKQVRDVLLHTLMWPSKVPQIARVVPVCWFSTRCKMGFFALVFSA